jgi:hypothetical protein
LIGPFASDSGSLFGSIEQNSASNTPLRYNNSVINRQAWSRPWGLFAWCVKGWKLTDNHSPGGDAHAKCAAPVLLYNVRVASGSSTFTFLENKINSMRIAYFTDLHAG